jgi:hypothetical protein
MADVTEVADRQVAAFLDRDLVGMPCRAPVPGPGGWKPHDHVNTFYPVSILQLLMHIIFEITGLR